MIDDHSIGWVRLLIAFTTVIGLIAALGFVLKYISMRGLNFSSLSLTGVTPRPRRIQVMESLMIDAQRKCVILRCDDREHLLLLGPTQDIVVATNLSVPPSPPESSS